MRLYEASKRLHEGFAGSHHPLQGNSNCIISTHLGWRLEVKNLKINIDNIVHSMFSTILSACWDINMYLYIYTHTIHIIPWFTLIYPDKLHVHAAEKYASNVSYLKILKAPVDKPCCVPLWRVTWICAQDLLILFWFFMHLYSYVYLTIWDKPVAKCFYDSCRLAICSTCTKRAKQFRKSFLALQTLILIQVIWSHFEKVVQYESIRHEEQTLGGKPHQKPPSQWWKFIPAKCQHTEYG